MYALFPSIRGMHLPRISVIMPAFLAHRVIPFAVYSAFSQGYSNLEVIVSPDDGLSYDFLLDEFPDNLIVLDSPEIGSGTGQARNRGIDAATGDFMVMLDADDVWHKGVLAELVPLAQDRGLAFLRANPVTPGMQSIRTPALYGPEFTFRDFGLAVCSVRPMMHKSIVQGYYGKWSAGTVHDAVMLIRHGPSPLVEAGYSQVISPESASSRGYLWQLKGEYADVVASCRIEPDKYGLGGLDQDGIAHLDWLISHRLTVLNSFVLSGAESLERWLAIGN